MSEVATNGNLEPDLNRWPCKACTYEDTPVGTLECEICTTPCGSPSQIARVLADESDTDDFRLDGDGNVILENACQLNQLVCRYQNVIVFVLGSDGVSNHLRELISPLKSKGSSGGAGTGFVVAIWSLGGECPTACSFGKPSLLCYRDHQLFDQLRFTTISQLTLGDFNACLQRFLLPQRKSAPPHSSQTSAPPLAAQPLQRAAAAQPVPLAPAPALAPAPPAEAAAGKRKRPALHATRIKTELNENALDDEYGRLRMEPFGPSEYNDLCNYYLKPSPSVQSQSHAMGLSDAHHAAQTAGGT